MRSIDTRTNCSMCPLPETPDPLPRGGTNAKRTKPRRKEILLALQVGVKAKSKSRMTTPDESGGSPCALRPR